MNLFTSLYIALLFVVLTPGVVLTLPVGSKLAVAAAHGLVFAVLYHLTYKTVWRLSTRLEGFQDKPMKK